MEKDWDIPATDGSEYGNQAVTETNVITIAQLKQKYASALLSDENYKHIDETMQIKGVVTGSVGITYSLPIINYGTADKALYKYAVVSLSFGVSEITPYSASILPDVGGKYRATAGFTSASSSNTPSATSYASAGGTLGGIYV